MNIFEQIAKELNIKVGQVENTVKLIDEGNTIPFIARYRKEVTGNLDDEILRNLEQKLQYLRNLEQRKVDVIRLIDELGELTEELRKEIINAETLSKVEDIYLPFRPKKRTRATIAKEKGLKPLADLILNRKLNESNFEQKVSEFIDEEKEVLTIEDAMAGALDIIAEMVSEDKDFRDILRNDANKNGVLVSEKEKKKTMFMICIMNFLKKFQNYLLIEFLLLIEGKRKKL